MPKNKNEMNENTLENQEPNTENVVEENVSEESVVSDNQENASEDKNDENYIPHDIKEEISMKRDDPDPEVQLLFALKDLEELKEKLADSEGHYLRLRAEFENYRKRTLSESERAKLKGIGTAIEAFFPAMDGIDRALSLCKDDGMSKGILLVKRQFQTALTTLGVTEINPVDEDFNPEYHNAVMNEVNPEKAGKVIDVFQRGYRYKDTLLRPAMVKVGIDE